MKTLLFRSLLALVCAVFGTSNLAVNAQSLEIRISEKLDSGDFSIEQLDRSDLALMYALEAKELLQSSESESVSTGIKARIHLNTAVALKRMRRPEEAIPEIIQLLELILEMDNQEYSPQYFSNLGRLAGTYLGMKEFDKAKAAFDKSIIVAQAIQEDLYIASSYNNLGLYLEQTGAFDEALHHYEIALESLVADNQQDSLLRVSIRDNIANIQLLRGNADSAVAIVEPDFFYIQHSRVNSKRKAEVGLRMAKLYMEAHQALKAREILPQVGREIKDPDHRWELEKLAELEKLWIENSQALNLTSQLVHHYQRLDSIRTKQLLWLSSNEEKFEAAIANYSMSRIKSELSQRSRRLKEAEQTAKINRLFLLIISCFSLFILSTGYIFHRRKQALAAVQRELKQSEIERQNLKNQQLQKDLSHKDKDFSDFIMRLTLKEDWVNDISEKLSEAIRDSDSVKADEITKIIRELKQHSGIHEKLDLYQSGIEDVNARFFNALSERFPELTKSEKEVCGLIRMNLDGKEIATIRSVDPASVRKMRQRIRKKLGLQPEHDLYLFIQNI